MIFPHIHQTFINFDNLKNKRVLTIPSFSFCFKRLNTLLLILMNFCIYKIESTVISRSFIRLFCRTLISLFLNSPSQYILLKMNVFSRFSVHMSLPPVVQLFIGGSCLIFTPGNLWQDPCCSSCVLCTQCCQFLLILHSVKIKCLTD